MAVVVVKYIYTKCLLPKNTESNFILFSKLDFVMIYFTDLTNIINSTFNIIFRHFIYYEFDC